MRVAGGLLIDRPHRRGGALALVLGVFAHAFILLADRAGAFGARLRHEAGHFARAGRGRFEKFIEQA